LSTEHIKFQTLQAGRGLAALLVVICHASAFVGMEPGLWHRHGVYLWLRGTALGVQLFFVLSGIVIFSAHRSELGRPPSVLSYLWRRFRRIYPLYWIFFALTVLRHNSVADAGLTFQRNPWVIASGIFLVHLFSTETNMVVAWTLFDEVLFYSFFLVLFLNKRWGAVLFTIWFGVSFFFLVQRAPYWTYIFSPNHLLFGLGMLASWLLQKNYHLPAKAIFWIGVTVFLACVICEGHLTDGRMAARLVAGVGAAGALFGAAELERRNQWATPSWLVFLGDASYSIYLAHFMVVSTVARICFARWPRLPIPIAIWMLLLILCGTGAGILTHLLIERPLLRLLGKPTGMHHRSLNTHVTGS
jgi:exopolysaccharide production protein ExoZ